MIPKYPYFIYLEANHLPYIQNLISHMPVYSDFNAASMWAWNTEKKTRISNLNGNLVVIFSDYLDGSPFLSFFGTNRSAHTTNILIEHARRFELPLELRLISEEAAVLLSDSDKDLIAVPDRDNYDYVVSTANIDELYGRQYKNLRWQYNLFEANHQNSLRYYELDLQSGEDLQSIEDVFYTREALLNSPFASEHEWRALQRLIRQKDCFNLHAKAIEVDGCVQAYFIYEITEQCAVGHFWKANTQYKGIYAYLFRTVCRELRQQGVEQINMEQDLGLAPLRIAKEMMRGSYLKKYRVTKLSTAPLTERRQGFPEPVLKLQLQ